MHYDQLKMHGREVTLSTQYELALHLRNILFTRPDVHKTNIIGILVMLRGH